MPHIDDTVTIQTPEGVEVELTLAGLGTRFGAALLDTAILAVVFLVESAAVTALLAAVDSVLLVVGIQSALLVLTLIAYFVLFELFNAGQTPGKGAFSIAVVDQDGQPVRFTGSILRNLVRLVDFLPALYLVGIIAILSTGTNQRIGDLAARTLVIQSRRRRQPPLLLPDPARFDGWDVSRVTPDDAAVIRSYLERMYELDPEPKRRLAEELTAAIRPKVVHEQPPELTDEAYLRAVLSLMTRASR